MCLLGDGTTNIGAFHESLNLAALWRLPIVYVIVNNQLGMGTPVEAAAAEPELWKRGCSYRMPGQRVDGNDVLAVRDAARAALRRARARAPARRCWRRSATGCAGTRWSTPPGTGTAEDTERLRRPRPAARVPHPAPGQAGSSTRRPRRGSRRRPTRQVAAAVDFADASPAPDVADRCSTTSTPRPVPNMYRGAARRPGRPTAQSAKREAGMTVISYRQALHDTLRAELQRDEDVFLIGEEIGVFEGSYKITAGLLAEFGPRRVRDTPICEEGFTGVADRRGDDGAAAGGGDHDDQLQPAGHRPDRQQRGQAAVAVRRPGQRAAGDPHPGRRRPAAVGHPLAEPGGLVRPRARAEGGRPGHPCRRQGPAGRRDPRRRPGPRAGEPGPVQHQGGGARRRARRGDRPRRGAQAGPRHHGHRLLAGRSHRPGRRPPAGRRRDLRRGHRPAQPPPAGPGHHLRLGPQDQPRGRSSRTTGSATASARRSPPPSRRAPSTTSTPRSGGSPPPRCRCPYAKPLELAALPDAGGDHPGHPTRPGRG